MSGEAPCSCTKLVLVYSATELLESANGIRPDVIHRDRRIPERIRVRGNFTFSNLRTLDWYYHAVPQDINDNGVVVGTANGIYQPGGRGFYWFPDGRFAKLTMLVLQLDGTLTRPATQALAAAKGGADFLLAG